MKAKPGQKMSHPHLVVKVKAKGWERENHLKFLIWRQQINLRHILKYPPQFPYLISFQSILNYRGLQIEEFTYFQ
jgi:hypothetical protein